MENDVLRKANSGEGLTVEEIIEYQKLVKPQKQVYGKYGTLKKKYLEEKGTDWLIENLPEYLHGIDRQADELYNIIYNRLSSSENYKKTGDFMKDLQIESEKKRLIDEEILNELIYV